MGFFLEICEASYDVNDDDDDSSVSICHAAAIVR